MLRRQHLFGARTVQWCNSWCLPKGHSQVKPVLIMMWEFQYRNITKQLICINSLKSFFAGFEGNLLCLMRKKIWPDGWRWKICDPRFKKEPTLDSFDGVETTLKWYRWKMSYLGPLLQITNFHLTGVQKINFDCLWVLRDEEGLIVESMAEALFR